MAYADPLEAAVTSIRIQKWIEGVARHPENLLYTGLRQCVQQFFAMIYAPGIVVPVDIDLRERAY